MKIVRIILTIVGLTVAVQTDGDEDGARDRRENYTPPLVFLYGGTFKLIIGIGIPIIVRDGRVLAYGQNMQFQYTLPTNASFFTNLFSDSSNRRRRSSSSNERAIAYSMLKQHYDRNGVDGKECIMRGICEAAETPLQEEGLVGELLHLLLTPDYGGSTTVDEDYINAKTSGLRGENCTELFPLCPPGRGILDHVSIIKYIK